MDTLIKGLAEAAISKMCEAQEKYILEDASVTALLEPLATSVEACDEIMKMLPECHARFRIFMIRKKLGGK